MFARSCPRMGMRFASGNVFYMNRMYSARHLNGVNSPLAMGFVSPLRMCSSINSLTLSPWGLTPSTSAEIAESVALAELIGGDTMLSGVHLEGHSVFKLSVSLKITTIPCIKLSTLTLLMNPLQA